MYVYIYIYMYIHLYEICSPPKGRIDPSGEVVIMDRTSTYHM